MPRYIIKLTDAVFNKEYYLEWSTIVDAPITYGMSLDEFEMYYRTEYGESGVRELPARMERVEKAGCSSFVEDNVLDLVRGNRAGKNESELSYVDILNNYCRQWVDSDGNDIKPKK